MLFVCVRIQLSLSGQLSKKERGGEPRGQAGVESLARERQRAFVVLYAASSANSKLNLLLRSKVVTRYAARASIAYIHVCTTYAVTVRQQWRERASSLENKGSAMITIQHKSLNPQIQI